MSKINNHTVGMNKINLAGDFQELTCEEAAAIHGGAKVILYKKKNWQGPHKDLSSVSPTRNFISLNFIGYSNVVSSIWVKSGVWQFRTNRGRPHLGTIIGPGRYTLAGTRLNNTLSLVKVKVA